MIETYDNIGFKPERPERYGRLRRALPRPTDAQLQQLAREAATGAATHRLARNRFASLLYAAQAHPTAQQERDAYAYLAKLCELRRQR